MTLTNDTPTSDGGALRLDRPQYRALLVCAVLLAGVVVFVREWYVAPVSDTKFWNGVVGFVLLGIACDSYFLPISRVSFARLSASVVFVPFIASVILFPHPWPMVIAASTAIVVQIPIRRRPFPRALFNIAQYSLAVGLGGFVYQVLGGVPGLTSFSFSLLPFACLVVTFFAVNIGSVSLAVATTSEISIKETLSRVASGPLLYDLVASSLSVLLGFLYVEKDLLGLGLLILPLFFVRHMYQMTLQVERVNRELLELMVKAIEARDPYTSGHSVRVAEYARSIAREVALAPRHIDQIATAALLHDVGKIYEEFAPLLRKEGKLSPEERMLMQAHPVRSAELVGTVAELRGPVQMCIRNHHENFDGSGYPDGLSGKAIPLGARIIMIADTLDAMTTDRPYRKALTLDRALEELDKYASRQFDPTLVALVRRSPSIRRLLGSQPGLDATFDRSSAKPTGRHGEVRMPVTAT